MRERQRERERDINRPAVRARAIEVGTAPYSIRWSAVFAGFVGALLMFVALLALGTAFAGLFLQGIFAASYSSELVPGYFVAGAIWLVLSLALSLFAGSYFAARFSGAVSVWAARAESLLVSGLLIVPLLVALFSVGMSTKPQYRDLATTFGLPRLNLAQSPLVSRAMSPVFDGLTMRVDLDNAQFALAKRLARNQTIPAYEYLERNAGIGRAEARRRIDPIQAQVIPALKQAGERAAMMIQLMGWLTLATILISAGAAIWGATVGARSVARTVREEVDQTSAEAAAA